MKKNIFFKLFTLVSFCIFCIIPVLAANIETANIARVVVDPILNNTYTLNLFFDNTYKGKAFLQKVSDGYYFVYLPDTSINKKNVKLIYKNKYDKKNIILNVEEKPYINKDKDSNYVRISVNMNADYSLKLISKNIADEKFNFFTDHSVNLYSLIILGLMLSVFLMFRKLAKLVKANKPSNSYTSFPDSFYIKQNKSTDNIQFSRNLRYRSNDYVSKPENVKPVKTADKDSFGCFDIPMVDDNKVNTYKFKSNIKQTSEILNKKPATGIAKQNKVINYNESQELDLPSAEDVIKPDEQKNENKAELLSILNITPNKGFYLTTVEDTIALFGFIGENVFLFRKFKDLSQINLQARFYDKNGDNDVYIVRLDAYKAMVEISNDSMKELAVL